MLERQHSRSLRQLPKKTDSDSTRPRPGPKNCFEDLRQKIEESKQLSRRGSIGIFKSARDKENRPQVENSEAVKARMKDLIRERELTMASTPRSQKQNISLARLREDAITARRMLQDVRRDQALHEQAEGMARAEYQSLIVQRVELSCEFEEIEYLTQLLAEKDPALLQKGREVWQLENRLANLLDRKVAQSRCSWREDGAAKLEMLTGRLAELGTGPRASLYQILCNFGSMFILQKYPTRKGKVQHSRLLEFICQQCLVDQFNEYVMAERNASTNKKFRSFAAEARRVMLDIQALHLDPADQFSSSTLQEARSIEDTIARQASQQYSRVHQVAELLARNEAVQSALQNNCANLQAAEHQKRKHHSLQAGLGRQAEDLLRKLQSIQQQMASLRQQ